ncbi:uncharacterized protein LOC124496933 [Dermatophagoides farinae]|uniref:uncharacterized protein LOC124496933 n=1 Tax=Dermatophagoides farinae TaxID=6954 RepID=UPI003F6347FF
MKMTETNRQQKQHSSSTPPSSSSSSLKRQISQQHKQQQPRQPKQSSPTLPIAPSSLLANQSENIPAPECCCFSARFVNLVLFLFNFIFLLSGICILLLTVIYGRPEVSRYLGETTKYLNNIINLLGNGHLVQIIHYSMLFCGIVIIVISLMNICFSTATSWSKSSDYYYYRRGRGHLNGQQMIVNENESLLFRYSDWSRNSPQQKQQPQQQQPQSSFRSTSLSSTTATPSKSAYLNESIILDDCSDIDISMMNDHHHNRYVSSTPSHQNNSSLLLIDRKYSNRLLHNNNNNHHHHHQCRLFQDQQKHSSWSHFANSTIVLCIYIFILLFLFTVQLVIGLLAIITVSPDHVFLSTNSARNNNDDFLISVRDSVDIADLLVNHSEEIESLYHEFQCCGWNYYDDYEYLRIINNDDDENQSIIIDQYRNKTIPVPDSCCKTFVENCGHRKHPNNIYYDGCWSKFGAEMRDYVLMLGWTALGFAIIELIGIMFAVCHYVQIMSKS